jgi:hypothetical protein
MIYHGVPGIGFVEIGLDLPFVLSSSKFRSDASPYKKNIEFIELEEVFSGLLKYWFTIYSE